jgi:hypothetical protein
MKKLLVFPFLLLVLYSCQQFNKKEPTLTPEEQEEAEFDKLFEQATPVFDSAYWARQDSISAARKALLQQQAITDSSDYHRKEAYQSFHEMQLTEDLPYEMRRFKCDSVFKEAREMNARAWVLLDSLLHALPEKNTNRVFFEALKKNLLEEGKRSGPKSVLFGLNRFGKDTLASSLPLKSYQKNEEDQWVSVLSEEGQWFKAISDSINRSEESEAQSVYLPELIEDYSAALERFRASDSLRFQLITPSAVVDGNIIGLYRLWNECEESARYVMTDAIGSKTAVLASKYPMDLEFVQDPVVDRQIQTQFWYTQECSDCLNNYRDQVVFARFKDLPIVLTQFGQRYLESQGQSGRPYTYERSILLIDAKGQLYPLWSSNYDNFHCACL